MIHKNLSAFQTQSNSAEAGGFSLEGKTLVGRQGKYEIDALLQSQPGIRIYLGKELTTQALVIVKEYYSFWWTAADIERIEAELEQLETIEFRSGGVQDFRLLTPDDVFASAKDQRCYLVLRPPQHPGQSLHSYLDAQGNLTAAQVRCFLSQVLQSLWFLHSQVIDFADYKTQKGMAHGNLSLDSILLVTDSTSQNGQFQVYLQDLELWETVMRPVSLDEANSLYDPQQKRQDLRDLGTIAAQLLLGELNPTEDWTPIEHPDWYAISDQPLKEFIEQLIGLETATFSSAKAARSRLLALPSLGESIATNESVEDTIELGQVDQPPLYFKIALAVSLSGVLINLGLLWSKGVPLNLPRLNSNGVEQIQR